MTEASSPTVCPNCGTHHDADFRFCPQCGQKAESSVMKFGDMVLDLLSAFFSFDSKAIRSLPLLLFKPGALTVAYLEGKRESYLSPFRFFIFLSIVLFLLLPLVVHDSDIFNPSLNGEDPTAVDSLVDAVLAESGLSGTGSDSAALRERENPGNLRWNVKRQEADQGLFQINDLDSLGSNRWTRATELVEAGFTYQAAIDSVYPEQKRLARLGLKQGLKLHMKKGAGLVGAFLDTTSYTLFIFLPAFAGLLKLIYIRRKRYFMEHLIFSMHFFSFFFFLLILYVLVFRFLAPLPLWPLVVIALVYLFAAMLRVYRQRAGRTLLKFSVLTGATAVFFVPVFFVVAVLISLLFY